MTLREKINESIQNMSDAELLMALKTIKERNISISPSMLKTQVAEHEYSVMMEFTGYITFNVTAASEDDAKKKAIEQFDKCTDQKLCEHIMGMDIYDIKKIKTNVGFDLTTIL